MNNWSYPHIVAHCGSGKLALKNTLVTTNMEARYGHIIIESDARLSKDDEIFSLHDNNLERTNNDWGVTGGPNWQDLLRMDTDDWFSGEFKDEPLPLLSQAAERCHQHGMMTNIEIRPTTGTGTLASKVVALATRELWMRMTPPSLSSFEVDALEAAQQAVPELPKGLLPDGRRGDWRELTTWPGCVSIHLSHKLLDEVRVGASHDAGLRILVHTANRPQRAAELLRWGASCIYTDAIDTIDPDFQPFWGPVVFNGMLGCDVLEGFSMSLFLFSDNMCCLFRELSGLWVPLNILPLLLDSICCWLGFSSSG